MVLRYRHGNSVTRATKDDNKCTDLWYRKKKVPPRCPKVHVWSTDKVTGTKKKYIEHTSEYSGTYIYNSTNTVVHVL